MTLVSGDAALRLRLELMETRRMEVLSENVDKKAMGVNEAVNVTLKLWDHSGRRRIVVGIGGFPASGKTTIAKEVTRQINEVHGASLAAHLPMDGFHFPNAILEARKLDHIKGGLATYDVSQLTQKLLEFRREPYSAHRAPDYIRELHEVQEDRIELEEEVRILVVEGIYVGYGEGNWRNVRALIDVLFFLDASPASCADRIVARNLAVGRGSELIKRKLINDFGFMEKCLTILGNADYIISPQISESGLADGSVPRTVES